MDEREDDLDDDVDKEQADKEAVDDVVVDGSGDASLVDRAILLDAEALTGSLERVYREASTAGVGPKFLDTRTGSRELGGLTTGVAMTFGVFALLAAQGLALNCRLTLRAERVMPDSKSEREATSGRAMR